MNRIPKDRIIWLVGIACITITIVLVSIFSLKNDIVQIFPYFYVLPVILLVAVYPRLGIYFTIALGWLYLGLVYLYGPYDLSLFAASSAWFYIFVTVGVIVSSYAEKASQNKKYKVIFSRSQAWIFTYDPVLKTISEINSQAATTLGYSEAELCGSPLSAIWADPAALEDFLVSVHAGRQVLDSEVEFVKKSGEKVWTLLTATLTDEGYVICSAIDETGRKQMRDRLQNEERKYKYLFNSLNAAIIIHDPSGKIFEANNIACEYAGCTAEDFSSMNLQDFDIRDSFYSFPDWFLELRRRGSLITEMVFRRADGSLLPCEVSSRIIDYLGEEAVITMVQDISERREAARSLEESERRYRMIGELIPFGVWVSDAAGNFTYLSASYQDLTGLTPEQYKMDDWLRTIPGEDRDRTSADWKQCVRNGCFWDYEYRVFDGEGVEHFVLSRGAPLSDDQGKVKSFVGIHLDITDRRRYQGRLEDSLREKEVVIKELHHRVKNNMQVISGFLVLQANYIDDPDTVEKLNECQRRVRTMALVHEKLYQSESLEFINTEEYIRNLATDLLDSYGMTTTVDLELDIEPLSITIDTAIPIGLIINELVTNAIKYAFVGRPSGRISISLHLGTDHLFNLVVQDDGVGLPADFDVRSALSLGMQLVEILTRQLGGQNSVLSEHGTRFEISFPEKF
jgi:PAS domain S-box-containing protein